MGCGEFPRGTVNCDIKKPAIKIKNFILCDALHLPFKSNTFDMCLSNHVIEHLNDPKEFLREVKKVLKVEGLFIVCTPNKFDLVDSYLGTRGHLWHFTRNWGANNFSHLHLQVTILALHAHAARAYVATCLQSAENLLKMNKLAVVRNFFSNFGKENMLFQELPHFILHL